jgi:putative redox protein
MSKPPVAATLVWEGGLRFLATSGTARMTIDSDGSAGPSPAQTLAFSIGGCMSMDLADILTKGRHPVKSIETAVSATRADHNPHRFLTVTLHFSVGGDVPSAAIERAIALSRDKYCSVWHSMRQDIGLTTTFEVRP